jgi:glycosyltransferase involved in cell wall biosynthesis
MKVANVIEEARVAGPQLRILAVAEALRNRDIETTVIHPVHDQADFVGRLESAKIDHVAVSMQSLHSNTKAVVKYLAYFPCDIFRLWRLFRRNDFDVVHCSGGFWQVKGLIAAKLAGREVIWHLNDTVMPSRLRPLFLVAARIFADRLIFAGRRVRNHYLAGALTNVPTFEIQAPVDCAKFRSELVQADPVLSTYSGIKVVTVSNLNPWKGIQYFLQMALALKKDLDPISFHVVGPLLESQSAYISELRSFIERNNLRDVHFHGASNNIPGILKAADIYVCSSVAEASPTSVWEAMAMEKAIVSTDVGDIARFVENGCSGFIVPPKDPVALATAVRRLATDSDLRKRFGQAARKTAMACLDVKICLREHEHAYRGRSIALLH